MDGDTFTKRAEGLLLRPYRCIKGKLSIGYGWNLDDRPIPREVADLLYTIARKEAVADCRLWLRGAWDQLSSVRQDVLVDMAYNLGLPRLSGFVNLRAALVGGDWMTAAKEMLDSEWARIDVPGRANALARVMIHNTWEAA